MIAADVQAICAPQREGGFVFDDRLSRTSDQLRQLTATSPYLAGTQRRHSIVDRVARADVACEPVWKEPGDRATG